MTPFEELLGTKYDPNLEDRALEILEQHPEIAHLKWEGPDDGGQPFVRGSTALHYAANDGKIRLVKKLIDLGSDVNADEANWYRSVLSWAANNARLETIELLLSRGAKPDSFDALHAASWGGSAQGTQADRDYGQALKILIEAGASLNDRRHYQNKTPLDVALESGNKGAIQFLKSRGAETSK